MVRFHDRYAPFLGELLQLDDQEAMRYYNKSLQSIVFESIIVA